MRAIDTNVIVRFLTKDDIAQWKRADALIVSEPVFIPTIVLLETEWVLRSTYEYGAEAVIKGLRDVVGLPTVSLENPELVALALEWTEQGMDFADALHLAHAQVCTSFVTFDQGLAKAAKRVQGVKVELL